jgi:hypothetical protein
VRNRGFRFEWRVFLVAGGIFRRRLGLDISRVVSSQRSCWPGSCMHRRRNIGEHILHALSGSRQGSETVGCEGEGEKFLMGIMTACHADPGLVSLRAGWRCLIELRSICSEASDRRSGTIRDASNASIGSKESIRGPVCFHSQLRLARDCQKLPETGKYQKVPANTETPPQLREFPSIYALSPTQLSHSLNPIIEDHNHHIKIFIRSLAQHFGISASQTALSDLTGCLFLESGGGTYRICLSLQQFQYHYHHSLPD